MLMADQVMYALTPQELFLYLYNHYPTPDGGRWKPPLLNFGCFFSLPGASDAT